MNANSRGESSRKAQENGDVFSETERPLKKARFAWQVKGKHHLKTERHETAFRSQHDAATSSSDSENEPRNVGNTEQNLEILGDYLLKQDFNTLDSVINNSDNSLPNPSPSVLSPPYPRYVSSYRTIGENTLRNNIRSDVYNNNHYRPPSGNLLENEHIARWQARQMAKGFVDNTINRVLESWMETPMPRNIDNGFLALDVAEFINNLPEDNSVENEGILMAISAHGLQNAGSSSSNVTEYKSESVSSVMNQVFPSPPSSPMSSSDETTDILERRPNEAGNSISNNEVKSFDDNSSSTGFSMFPETALDYGEQEAMKFAQLNTYYDENACSNENDEYTNHFNFMDAAVSFAIQNKGLTSFGTDYG